MRYRLTSRNLCKLDREVWMLPVKKGHCLVIASDALQIAHQYKWLATIYLSSVRNVIPRSPKILYTGLASWLEFQLSRRRFQLFNLSVQGSRSAR